MRSVISLKSPTFAQYEQIFYSNYSPAINASRQQNKPKNESLKSSIFRNKNNIRVKFKQSAANLLYANKSVKFNPAFEKADEEESFLNSSNKDSEKSVSGFYKFKENEFKNNAYFSTIPFIDTTFNFQYNQGFLQQQHKSIATSPLKSSSINEYGEQRITLNLKDDSSSNNTKFKETNKIFNKSDSKCYTNPLVNYESFSNKKSSPPILRQISIGMGHKKRRALFGILISFSLFLILYIIFIFYAILS